MQFSQSGVTRRFVRTAGGVVHLAEAGTGPALVLLHMSPRSWTAYRMVIPLLATTHRVIAMDTLGFGNSEDPPAGYGIADYAASVVDLLDELGVERANVWGSMTGSRIACELAANWPDRIERLVLMGFPFFADKKQQQDRIRIAEEEQWWVPRLDGSHLGEMWNHALYGYGKDIPVQSDPGPVDPIGWQYAIDYMADGLRAGAGYLEAAKAVYLHDPIPALERIDASTLVVGLAGDRMRSHIAERGRAEAVARLIRDSQVERIETPTADCRATYYHADRLSLLVRRFIAAT